MYLKQWAQTFEYYNFIFHWRIKFIAMGSSVLATHDTSHQHTDIKQKEEEGEVGYFQILIKREKSKNLH